MDQSSWMPVQARPDLPSHLLFTKPIRKNDVDTRDYRLIKLENGLQALLIHDAKADKAAAAMDIGVGHMADPDDMPGLAHFCEHLLFMGTKVFPSETEYKHYITSYGGSSNAYTSTTETCYHFSIGSAHLSGAIERFSSFFHSPLFAPNCTMRELNAVDSEHRKNDQSDVFRIWQLFKDLSIPGHPFGKFGTGSIATLTQAAKDMEASKADNNTVSAAKDGESEEKDGGFVAQETRRRLIEWWEKHYCASIMSLAVIGVESLDDLTTLVLDHFSAVPNRGLTMPTYDRPWGPKQCGKLVLAKTVMDVATLEIEFPISGQDVHYRSKPTVFLSHFIGHEGVGSLHSYLKQKGWLTRLWSGGQSTGRGFGFFKINIRLTKSGLENYRSVLDAVYSYLSLMRSTSLPTWYFEELKVLQEISFRFSQMQQPESYVTRLAESLLREWAKEDLLCASTLMWDYDEKLVRETLERDLAPAAGTVMITAKDFAPIGVTEGWQKEKWYGTQYIIRPLEPEILEKAARPNQISELHLPRVNEFVPQNLTVEKQEVSQPAKRPLLISKTPISSLWYKKDDQFWLPKGWIGVFIRTPVANSSVKKSAMTRIVVSLVNDALTEYSYDASMAGLDYSLKEQDGTIMLQQRGYTDKALILWQHLLEKMKSHIVRQDRFIVYKQEIKKGLENALRAEPYAVVHGWTDYVLQEVAYKYDELIEVIDHITAEEAQEHLRELFSRARVTIVLDGNFSPKDALQAQALVDQTLQCEGLLPDEAPDRNTLLPPGKNFVHHQTLKNPLETNNAVQYYLQIPDASDAQVAKLRLFAHVVNERAFSRLRTTEQLGYVVMSSAWIHTTVAGMMFRVQSEKSSVYVESRIDAFLEGLKEELQTIDQNDFEKQRKGLVTKLTQKFVNLDQEYAEFANRINSGAYDFTSKAKSAALVETFTLSDVQDFYATYIDPRSKQRAKLSLHLHAQAKPAGKAGAGAAPIKFSIEASNAFLVDLKAAQFPVDEPQYIASSKAEPPLEAVLQFWTMHLGNVPFISKEKREQLLERAKELAKLHPVGVPVTEESLNKGSLLEGTIVVDDLATLKKELPLSKPPVPVMSLEVEEIPVDNVGSKL